MEPLLLAFSKYLHSSQFRDLAPHPGFSKAFTRDRKLPLHALLAVLLSGMRKGIQAELDESFAHLEQRAQLVRHVSERAFFSARAKLSATAIPALNAWLVQPADAAGFVPCWQGTNKPMMQKPCQKSKLSTIKSGGLRAAPNAIHAGQFSW